MDVDQLDPDLYKVIGGTHVISKDLMGRSVKDGNCIAVALKDHLPHYSNEQEQDGMEDGTDWSSDEINWICEDDFEQYWENNCMPVRPIIDQCLDELSLAKHHGDAHIL